MIKELAKQIPGLRKGVNAVNQLINEWQFAARVKNAESLKIVIGSSGIFDEGWIPSEAYYLHLLKPADWQRFFKKDSIDALLAEHVWEHLSLHDGYLAAMLCFAYLKPGGYLRVAVPDGYHPDPQYIDHVKVGGTGPGSDDHKVLYTYRTFQKIFEDAGFDVELLEYFDDMAQFQSTPWDPGMGKIHRSKQFDERNTHGKLNYTSIILDAYKPK